MSKTTLSTWVSPEVHKKFGDYCNSKGLSLSQGLSDLIYQALGLSETKADPQLSQLQLLIKLLGEKKSKKCKYSKDGFCFYWEFSKVDKEKFTKFQFEEDKEGWDDKYTIKICPRICGICSEYQKEEGWDYEG